MTLDHVVLHDLVFDPARPHSTMLFVGELVFDPSRPHSTLLFVVGGTGRKIKKPPGLGKLNLPAEQKAAG